MKSGADISVVWVGFHIEGKPALEAVCNAGFHVTTVVSHDDYSASNYCDFMRILVAVKWR